MMLIFPTKIVRKHDCTPGGLRFWSEYEDESETTMKQVDQDSLTP